MTSRFIDVASKLCSWLFGLRPSCSKPIGDLSMNAIAYACDIGSIKSGAFAWARNSSLEKTPTASDSIDELITCIVEDGKAGKTIALGFEAPLFMPVPTQSAQLNSGRQYESSRSMFAPAGATVTTIAIHQTAWILKQLHQHLGHRLTLTMDWLADWRKREAHLFIWEAFVSSGGHSDPQAHNSHKRDAATALQYFLANADNLDGVNSVTCENPLSLIAAAALWSGWLADVRHLHSSCLVLRPEAPYQGEVL